MSDKVDNYTTQRIDQLLDDRIEDLRNDIQRCSNSVEKLHKLLIGNGAEGILQKVSINSAKIKILMWVSSVIFAAVVGSYFKIDKITIPAMDDLPKITIENKQNTTTNKVVRP